MKPVTETRHERLLLLIEQHGTVQRIADLTDKSYAQISQLKNRAPHSKSGVPRQIGHAQARELEVKLGLPAGWMDTPIEPDEKGNFGAGMSPRALSIAQRLSALPEERQARAYALLDLTLRTLEAEK